MSFLMVDSKLPAPVDSQEKPLGLQMLTWPTSCPGFSSIVRKRLMEPRLPYSLDDDDGCLCTAGGSGRSTKSL